MSDKPVKEKYHHGNLREALIEAGVRIIKEQGEDELSLRKVAAACGVSHAAPYAHFPDKESLLLAIKEDVTNGFMEELKKAVENPLFRTAEEKLLAMGQKYIMYFRSHPDYYDFMFHKQNIQVHTDMSNKNPEDYPPFLLFRGLIKDYYSEQGIEMSPIEQEMDILRTWGIVHGLASIASMPNVEVTIPWEYIAAKSLRGLIK